MNHVPNDKIRRKTRRVYNSVDKIEPRQLEWYALVMRMGDNRLPKRALDYTPLDRRRRPALSWRDMELMADRAIIEDDWMDRAKCAMQQRP